MKRDLFKMTASKSAVMSIIILLFGLSLLHGSDMFPSVQLTSDPAQEGFATWSPDGKYIVYSHVSHVDSLGRNGLWRISPDGKNAKQIFAGIAEHPQWSPDGKYIAFDADSGNSMKMIPAEGGTPVRFVPDSIQIKNGGLPFWSPDGSQIMFLEGGIKALDVVNIKTGIVARIFQQDGKLPIPGCWTPDGESIIFSLRDIQTRKSTLWKISADGKEKQQITGHHEGLYRFVAFSPDGSLLIYGAIDGGNLGLWAMPADGGRSIQFASQPRFNESPSFSPDGKKMAFTSTRSGNFDIWLMDWNMEEIKKRVENEMQIEKIIIEKEKSLLNEWGKGNTMIYPQNSAAEISYFDPSLEKRIDGLDAYAAYLKPLENKFTIESYEMIDPRVQIHGDVAVLTFNLIDDAVNAQGIKEKSFWNATEVYKKFGEDWRIIHSHWSYTKPELKK